MDKIKLEDLNVVPLEEIRRKLDKSFSKMVSNGENDEIGEELSIDKIECNQVNNLILKPEEFGELFRRNNHLV